MSAKRNENAPFWVALRAYEKRLIEDSLREARGIIVDAAALLGVDRTFLSKKIKGLGINPKEHKAP